MIISIIAIVVLASAIWIYNLLVKDRNQVRAAWSDIDVQLKRHYDLVPQLVTAVKAYAGAFHVSNLNTFTSDISKTMASSIATASMPPPSSPSGMSGGGWRRLVRFLYSAEDEML